MKSSCGILWFVLIMIYQNDNAPNKPNMLIANIILDQTKLVFQNKLLKLTQNSKIKYYYLILLQNQVCTIPRYLKLVKTYNSFDWAPILMTVMICLGTNYIYMP